MLIHYSHYIKRNFYPYFPVDDFGHSASSFSSNASSFLPIHQLMTCTRKTRMMIPRSIYPSIFFTFPRNFSIASPNKYPPKAKKTDQMIAPVIFKREKRSADTLLVPSTTGIAIRKPYINREPKISQF